MLSAIRSLLLDSPTVTDPLATYAFGDHSGGVLPAIFVGEAPESCEEPLIEITSDGGQSGGLRGVRGGDWQGEVRVYGERLRTNKSLYQAAMAIWRTLDREFVTPDGFALTQLQCSLPATLPRAGGFPGYRMSLNAEMEEAKNG